MSAEMSIEAGLLELDDAIGAARLYFRDECADAEKVATRVRDRVQIGGESTVVAFAGATGSGKSSLVNALVGEPVAEVAPTRPTTAEPLSVSGRETSEVLDWMGVGPRHVLPGAFGDDSVILVDLPDLDSTEEEHRSAADRVIERADVVVFVLDPQKYADALLHREYLKRFGEHGAVTLVVLNQVDRLAQREKNVVLVDARGLLATDGLRDRLIPTSARTGEGVEQLRRSITEIVSKRNAARLRLGADLRSAGEALAVASRKDGGASPSAVHVDFMPAARAMVSAAGGDAVAEAAARSYDLRSRRETPWKSRSAHRAPDPLDAVVGPSGIPRYIPEPARIPAAQMAVRTYVDNELAALPTSWKSSVARDVDARTVRLIESTGDAAKDIEVGDSEQPSWWGVTRALFRASLATVAVGVLWLFFWAALGMFDPPKAVGVGLPIILIGLGLLAALAVWIGVGVMRSRGSNAARERVMSQLARALDDRAGFAVREPVEAQRAEYSRFVEAIGNLSRVR